VLNIIRRPTYKVLLLDAELLEHLLEVPRIEALTVTDDIFQTGAGAEALRRARDEVGHGIFPVLRAKTYHSTAMLLRLFSSLYGKPLSFLVGCGFLTLAICCVSHGKLVHTHLAQEVLALDRFIGTVEF
jgi:hypothetical protein